MTSKSKFIWHDFESISKEELYDVLSLRQKVFIIEQDCFYEDLDYSDQDANHLLLYRNDKLVGYSRVFPPGIKYKTCLLYTSPSPRDKRQSRMPSSA